MDKNIDTMIDFLRDDLEVISLELSNRALNNTHPLERAVILGAFQVKTWKGVNKAEVSKKTVTPHDGFSIMETISFEEAAKEIIELIKSQFPYIGYQPYEMCEIARQQASPGLTLYWRHVNLNDVLHHQIVTHTAFTNTSVSKEKIDEVIQQSRRDVLRVIAMIIYVREHIKNEDYETQIAKYPKQFIRISRSYCQLKGLLN